MTLSVGFYDLIQPLNDASTGSKIKAWRHLCSITNEMNRLIHAINNRNK